MTRLNWRSPLSACAALIALALSPRAEADAPSPAQVLQDLRAFGHFASVLHIAAHPDDENTQLITYLSRGRGYRTAYLSATRGDGGQNVIGPEFFEQLGVIRTQELLAARRLDGGQQFFTRAIDFGFSKDVAETLRTWDRQAVLADYVRVIRTFRPDVLIVRFNPATNTTHGHHTASAVLGLEAFKLAGDPTAFPEQLKGLTVWQPKRVLLNGGGRGGAPATQANAIQIDVSGTDPVNSETFATIARQSRGMHKSQGFGTGGPAGPGGPRNESFVLLAGDPMTGDIMDGIDATWNRVGAGGAEIAELIAAAIARFDAKDPSASVPALLAIRERVLALPADRGVEQKREQLDRILQGCLGLVPETVVRQAQVVPGETMHLRHAVTVASAVPVRWVAVRYPSIGREAPIGKAIVRGEPASLESDETLPLDTPLTQPYWLRQPGAAGVFRVDDAELIGRAENPPVFPIEYVFEVGGQTLVIPGEPVEVVRKPGEGESRRRLDATAPVSFRFLSEVALFAPGATRTVSVRPTAHRRNVTGTVELRVPAGWRVSTPTQAFSLAAAGDSTRIDFSVTAPDAPASGTFGVRAEVGGRSFGNDLIEIRYDHIPPQVLQPLAQLKGVCLEVATRGKTVGYIPGAGDNVAECIGQLGYDVTELTGADVTPEKLKQFDAVVLGVRALNVRTDLADRMQPLFDYAAAGGTVIVQYNRPDGIKTNAVAPYDLRLSGDRVTDESAAVTFLAPEHPVLNAPNKITPKDFDGWVQERGIYFPNRWGEQFTPILGMADPNEAPLKGGLLIARHGEGHFVYTGLVWFRQLPEGVPGAYRLMANLLSLGKRPPL